MIKNFSLILKLLQNLLLKKIAQQRSLDSVVKVVLDNRIALDYFFAEQSGVYALVTTCYA